MRPHMEQRGLPVGRFHVRVLVYHKGRSEAHPREVYTSDDLGVFQQVARTYRLVTVYGAHGHELALIEAKWAKSALRVLIQALTLD